VGCAALGGAAAGAATNIYRSKVQHLQSFSWRSLAMETGVGALAGTLGGGVGQKLASAMAPAVLEGVVAASGRSAAQRAGSSLAQAARSAAVGIRATVSRSGGPATAGTASGAVSGTAGHAAGDSMELFRAVGVREYDAVMSSGRFAPAANSLEGRQFATTQAEALAYAATDRSKVAILRATVRRSAVEGVADFSRNIDVSIFTNGVYTVQPGYQSDIFHAGLMGVDHVF
jgi:hypothetical protein